MSTPVHFSNLKLARDFILIGYKNTFIVQQELADKREYLVFSSVDDYYDKISTYNNCHEILINRSKYQGRLAFDFDVPLTVQMTNFNKVVEDAILRVLSKYYKKKCTPDFVWLSSENTKKHSKHLIVKGVFFVDDWKEQTNYFYNKMALELKSTTLSPDIVDKQLSRLNASLRMPFNSKLGGKPLLFENEKHTFKDGLMGIYSVEDLILETKLTTSDQVEDFVLRVKSKQDDIPERIAERSFCVFEQNGGKRGVFKFGSFSGEFVQLMRIKPNICLVDRSKYHESDNAYLLVKNNKVKFGCHRGCSFNGKKLVDICDLYNKDRLYSFLLKNCELEEDQKVDIKSIVARSTCYNDAKIRLIDKYDSIEDYIEEFESCLIVD